MSRTAFLLVSITLAAPAFGCANTEEEPQPTTRVARAALDGPWLQGPKIVPDNLTDDDWFGTALTVDGDLAAFGARNATVYIRQRDQDGRGSWGELARRSGTSTFGQALSLDGDTLAIGSWNDGGTGAVFIHQRDEGGADNWGEVASITPPSVASGDQFGGSVALAGDVLVAGAAEAAGTGQAHIFMRDQGGADNWGQVAVLAGAATGDAFGQDVAIDGDLIAISAFRHDGVGVDSGAAYVYERNAGGADNWGEVAELAADDAAADIRFGYSVAVNGDLIAVGAQRGDGAEAQSGALYLFARDEGGADNWGQVTKITHPDGKSGDRFGESVATDGDLILVGAPRGDAATTDEGAAYLYGRDEGGADNWGMVAELTADDGESGDLFADEVAINGSVAVAGQIFDDDGGSNSGAAYVFESNDFPVAADDTAQTPEGTDVTIDVLANDSDPDDDPLTIDSVTTPSGGTASIDGDAILYTPDAGFSGDDSFDYTISDGRDGTATATVTVTVEPDEVDMGMADAGEEDMGTGPGQDMGTTTPNPDMGTSGNDAGGDDGDDGDTGDDGVDGGSESDGCGCAASGAGSVDGVLLLLAVLFIGRRRR